MTCNCEVCEYKRKVDAHLASIEEPAKSFFADMYDLLFHAQFDLDHANAVISGDWPNADEYIAAVRTKK